MQMPAKKFNCLYKTCSRKRGDLRHLLRKSRMELAEERMMEIQAELSQPSSSCSSSVGSPSASPFFTTSTAHQQQSPKPSTSNSNGTGKAAVKPIRPNSSASTKSCGNGKASSVVLKEHADKASTSPYGNHHGEEEEAEPAGQQEHGLDGKQQEATSSNARVEEEPIEDEHPEDEEAESLKTRKRPFINHKCQSQQMEQDDSHAIEQPQQEVKKPRLMMMTAPNWANEEEPRKKEDHLNGRRMATTTPERRRSSCHGEDMPTLEELFSF